MQAVLCLVVGGRLRSSHPLKREAKYPRATERTTDTKGMVVDLRERGCLTEVKRHPRNGKAESLVGVTAHHIQAQNVLQTFRR